MSAPTDKAVIAAVHDNDTAALQRLLQAGADPNAHNEDGETVMMIAAYENQIDMLRILIDAGADLNMAAISGMTALQYAVGSDHLEAVRILLEAGGIDAISRASVMPSSTNPKIRRLLSETINNHLKATLEEMKANATVRSSKGLISSETTDNPEIAQLPTFAEQQQEPTGNAMSRTDMYDFLLRRDGAKCQGCGRAFDDPRYLEIDHIMPRSDGGSDHISNRVLLCGPCNRAKGNQYTLSGLRRLNKKNGWMVEP